MPIPPPTAAPIRPFTSGVIALFYAGIGPEASESATPRHRTASNRKYNSAVTKPLLKRILNFLNPRYHFQRLREDLILMRKALALRKSLNYEDHDISLESLFRGKLFSTFMLSGPFGLLSIPIGYWAQISAKDNFIGFFLTMFLVAFFATAAYQVIWWHDNKHLYRRVFKSPFDRFRAMQRDLWPVHWTGIRVGGGLAFITTMWVAGIVIGLLKLLVPVGAEKIPTNVLVLILDAIFVQGPFLRIMGDFFERHGHKLAARYQPALLPPS
jgi:hypothetical protein